MMRAAALCSIFLAASTGVATAGEIDLLLANYGNLSTVAGRGWFRGSNDNGWQTSMEGGSALTAELSRPHMTMADAAGNLYIADKLAHAIRKVTPDGTIHTIAGTNSAGFNGDAGLGTSIQLNNPNGLYTFPDGTTFILDLDNSRIRKLTPDGMISTVVNDPAGMYIGRGLWVSDDQKLIYYSSYQVTGSATGVVRRWKEGEGLSTYATGLVQPGNLDVDPTDGNLVVTDRSGHRVWKVFDDGAKQVIAGNGSAFGGGSGSLATQTGLYEVRGVHFRDDGSYFLATHAGGQIWFVDTAGVIHLLIDGDENHTHWGDGLPLTTPGKKISEPRAVALAPNGDLLVTESDFGYVRVVPWIGVPEPSPLSLWCLGGAMMGVYFSCTARTRRLRPTLRRK